MECLPKEMIADILSRLIVKHLLICKCVCHDWYDLISDRCFVKLHREQLPQQQRLVYHRYPNSIHTADFDSLEGEASLAHPPLIPHNESAVVIGSCHGLLCLCELGRCNTRFALYNPTTRLYSILPWTPFEGNIGLKHEYMLYYGFGYDSISDDYKVVRIAQTSEDPSDYFRCDARVYSLITNAWKKVADVPYCLSKRQIFGTLVNGALHFLAIENPEQTVPDKIVAFKLGDESYYSLPQPHYTQWPKPEEERRWLTIGVLDGCLSIVDNYCSEDHHYGVWIMKEYGVQRPWSKLYKLGFPEPIPLYTMGEHTEPIPPCLRPISFSKNRKVLFFMVYFSLLVVYVFDLEKRILQPVVHPDGQVVTEDVHIYQETLTSPFAGTHIGDDDEESLGLPEDIMMDILVRLSVKSIGRFKSVSWSWYDLISNPRFAAHHVEWSRKASFKLHMVYNGPGFSLRHAEFDSFDGDTSLDHPLIGPEYRGGATVVGEADGLLCVCETGRNHLSFPFGLYNATTRSSTVLPPPHLDGYSPDYNPFLGFGYDATNDDYKVVKIAQPEKEGTLREYAQVYSLNTNSWKRVTTAPFRLTGFLYSGVCVNSVVHWIAGSDSDEKLYDDIAGFDLAEEKYFLVPQPRSLEPILGRRSFKDIGVLDGCLSLVCNFLDEHFHDVWVMKEYGEQSSWSKLFRIVDEEVWPIILKPKSFSRSRRELFLMDLCNGLVSYNLEDKKLRRCAYPDGVCWDVHIYKETLVSPDAGDGNWEDQV